MKKNIIQTGLFLFLSGTVFGQLYKRPCSYLPSTKEILQTLSSKPISGLALNNLRQDCNLNDSVKKRLIYLLNWQWTDEEIENYIQKDFENNRRWYDMENRARLIAKGNDSLYKISLDSIKNVTRANRLKDMKEGKLFQVDGTVILAAGRYNIKEAIPILQKALNDPEHYNRGMVELSLAMLGDKYATRKVVSECSPDPGLSGDDWFEDFIGGRSAGKGRKLIYIGSQESIYKMAEWMDTSKVRAFTSSGNVKIKCASAVISYLAYTLVNKDFLNLIKEFIIPSGEDETAVTSEMILQCRKWLLRNKGKYKINKHFFP